jgi:hypothetical protein
MTAQVDRRGSQEAVDRNELQLLERSFAGRLFRPADRGYDFHRKVWNGSIDRHPALIARCRTIDDVVAALRFGRRANLPIAVRSGGHSFPGLSVCDDGIVIDVRSMHRVRVDPKARRVRAEAGVLLGELDSATQTFGLAVPTGSVTHTGLAGLTLGGGFGWLMRRHGLAIDQLRAAQLVTADGQVLPASETVNPDLFWGVRGGGGNFGIATAFEYALHPVGPTVLSGLLLWPFQEGPEMVRHYRDWAASVPDEMTTALIVRRAPAVPLIPTALHGQLVVGVGCCWAGAPEQGERVLEPMRRFGSSSIDLVGLRPFVEHQAMFDAGFPPGIWIHSKATDVRDLNDEVLDVLLAHGERVRSSRSGIIAWQLGGAVGRVGELETAFGGRSSGYLVDILGATDSAEGFEREREWARECWTDLTVHRSGVYVNWLMDEGERRVREAYGETRFARLQAVKRRYDPENVFRLNQNIRPA